MPGTLRSSVYLPAPVVFSAASTIAVALPITEKSLADLLVGMVLYSVLGTARRSAAIADRIASYIWLYPVQRHRLLLSAERISSSDGLAFSASNDFTVMMNPGVQ